MEYDHRGVQAVEMPTSGGVATARAVATLYNVMERAINDGGSDNPLSFDHATLAPLLSAPASPVRSNGWVDEVLGCDVSIVAYPQPLPHEGNELPRQNIVRRPQGLPQCHLHPLPAHCPQLLPAHRLAGCSR